MADKVKSEYIIKQCFVPPKDSNLDNEFLGLKQDRLDSIKDAVEGSYKEEQYSSREHERYTFDAFVAPELLKLQRSAPANQTLPTYLLPIEHVLRSNSKAATFEIKETEWYSVDFIPHSYETATGQRQFIRIDPTAQSAAYFLNRAGINQSSVCYMVVEPKMGKESDGSGGKPTGVREEVLLIQGEDVEKLRYAISPEEMPIKFDSITISQTEKKLHLPSTGIPEIAPDSLTKDMIKLSLPLQQSSGEEKLGDPLLASPELLVTLYGMMKDAGIQKPWEHLRPIAVPGAAPVNMPGNMPLPTQDFHLAENNQVGNWREVVLKPDGISRQQWNLLFNKLIQFRIANQDNAGPRAEAIVSSIRVAAEKHLKFDILPPDKTAEIESLSLQAESGQHELLLKLIEELDKFDGISSDELAVFKKDGFDFENMTEGQRIFLIDKAKEAGAHSLQRQLFGSDFVETYALPKDVIASLMLDLGEQAKGKVWLRNTGNAKNAILAFERNGDFLLKVRKALNRVGNSIPRQTEDRLVVEATMQTLDMEISKVISEQQITAQQKAMDKQMKLAVEQMDMGKRQEYGMWISQGVFALVFGYQMVLSKKQMTMMEEQMGVNGKDKRTSIEKYTTDMLKLARDGRLEPGDPRLREVEVQHILSRIYSSKSAMLLGYAGVGKTAVVELLAQRIADGGVPGFNPSNTVMLRMNLEGLMGGDNTQYRGVLEKQVMKLFAEIDALEAEGKHVILFIDEIHKLVGMGSTEGSSGIDEMLKERLARKGISVVGATTTIEYKERVERNEAFARRFGVPIYAAEMNQKDTLTALKSLQKYFGDPSGKSSGANASDAMPRLYISESAISLVADAVNQNKAIFDVLDAHVEYNPGRAVKWLETLVGDMRVLKSYIDSNESPKSDAKQTLPNWLIPGHPGFKKHIYDTIKDGRVMDVHTLKFLLMERMQASKTMALDLQVADYIVQQKISTRLSPTSEQLDRVKPEIQKSIDVIDDVVSAIDKMVETDAGTGGPTNQSHDVNAVAMKMFFDQFADKGYSDPRKVNVSELKSDAEKFAEELFKEKPGDSADLINRKRELKRSFTVDAVRYVQDVVKRNGDIDKAIASQKRDAAERKAKTEGKSWGKRKWESAKQHLSDRKVRRSEVREEKVHSAGEAARKSAERVQERAKEHEHRTRRH